MRKNINNEIYIPSINNDLEVKSNSLSINLPKQLHEYDDSSPSNKSIEPIAQVELKVTKNNEIKELHHDKSTNEEIDKLVKDFMKSPRQSQISVVETTDKKIDGDILALISTNEGQNLNIESRKSLTIQWMVDLLQQRILKLGDKLHYKEAQAVLSDSGFVLPHSSSNISETVSLEYWYCTINGNNCAEEDEMIDSIFLF